MRRFQSHTGQLGTAAWASAERRVKGSITGAAAHSAFKLLTRARTDPRAPSRRAATTSLAAEQAGPALHREDRQQSTEPEHRKSGEKRKNCTVELAGDQSAE